MIDKNKKYPEGHFLGVGIAIGIPIFSGVGIALSNSTGNPGLIGIGPAIGVILGLAIGKSMEDKYRKQGLVRQLTEKEKLMRKRGKLIGAIAVVIGVIALISIVLLR